MQKREGIRGKKSNVNNGRLIFFEREKGMEKILVANRGEIALRVIRTLKKMGIGTVAVYSEPDEPLPFVREADHAFCIGKGPVRESYMNQDRLLEIAKKNGVDGIHPGYGFLSEDAGFARRVMEAGMVFIGPKPDTIALMGDKLAARQAMARAGVAVVPGSPEVGTAEEAAEAAREIGFPVMLKASGGGGGIGMALCRTEEEVCRSFQGVQSRAKAYFRSGGIYVEKFIGRARHVEIQVAGDARGNLVHLFERDCSAQRRNQKVIEETHSPLLSRNTRERMYEAALRAARAVSYENVGTVEFIVDEAENFYFLEMNTRLQVEHPVTEAVTGIDFVEWQVLLASGKPLPKPQQAIVHRGHAVEFRIYAEDPDNFYPSPGVIEKLAWGRGDDVRTDAGYEAGNRVSPFYDPLIAKCVFHGKTREDCLARAEKFFAETEIEGIKTNIPLLRGLIAYPPFAEGKYFTDLVQEYQREKGGKGDEKN
ncbi:MAG: biotin carboxylase [Caldibacillus debilis]|nr:biotin carboxylase [Bacillaceae bacterium]REJ20154.1 MAG: biotin carboxylase [Caldibacillus debilis]